MEAFTDQTKIIPRKADESEYMLWEDIKKLYPDRFVLIENPVYNPPNSPCLYKGIVRYKNKSKMKVAEKGARMKIPYGTISYTDGPLLENTKDYIFIF